MLHQFHYRLEKKPVSDFTGTARVTEHAAAGEIGVVGDGHNIAAVVEVNAVAA